MKNKKIYIYPLIIALLFLVIYTIIALFPMHREIQLQQKWIININQNPTKKAGEKKLIHFKAGSYCGYFDEDGKLIYKYYVNQRCSISDDYFVLYGTDSASFTVQNPDSSKVVRVNASGFPFIDENRIYLFSPGGNSVSSFDIEGNKLFAYQGYSPLLAFGSSSKGCVLGFTDGEIHAVYNDSTQLSTYPLGSSRQIIYGADISDNEDLIACVSGYDLQRFVLIKRTDNQQKIIFHEYVPVQSKESASVCFTKDSRYVYYGCGNNVGIVDCKKLKSRHFEVTGKVLKVAEIPEENVVFILSKEGRDCKITIVESSLNVIGEYYYKANSTFVNSNGNCLYIGADNEIACLEIFRK